MTDSVTIKWTPPDLPRRMATYPQQMEKEAERAGRESLDAIHQVIPAYPPPPATSRYIRTGRLGSSLGSSMSGGKGGFPDVYEFKRLGEGRYEGTFGSLLSYAQWVVGTKTQAWMHRGRWWVMLDLLNKSKDKMQEAFSNAGKRMVSFIEGGR